MPGLALAVLAFVAAGCDAFYVAEDARSPSEDDLAPAASPDAWDPLDVPEGEGSRDAPGLADAALAGDVAAAPDEAEPDVASPDLLDLSPVEDTVAGADAEPPDVWQPDEILDVEADPEVAVAVDAGPGPTQTWSGGFVDVRKQIGIFDMPFKVPPQGEDPLEDTIIAGDFNGDGVADIVTWVKKSSTVNVYMGAKKPDGTLSWKWEKLPVLLPYNAPMSVVMAAIAADTDGDGLDELITVGPHVGWWRRGTSGWVDGSLALQIPEYTDGRRQSVALFDVDADGLLDLMVSRSLCQVEPAPELWIDRGNGSFVDWVLLLGVDHAASHWAGLMTDSDMDGLPDLVWLSDGCFGPTAQPHFHNAGRGATGRPEFVQTAPQDFFAFPGPKIPFTSPMAGVSFDFDGDGRLDFYVTNVGWHPPPGVSIDKLGTNIPELKNLLLANLFRGQPDGTWEEVGEAAGLKHFSDVKGKDLQGWTPAAMDFDRDGLPDLLIVHGPESGVFWEEPDRAPMRLVAARNKGDGTFEERSKDVGLPDPHEGRSLQVYDFDADGDQDLLVGTLIGQPLVLRNDLVTGKHHVRIKLRGRVSNVLGIGAKVRVFAGGKTWIVEHGASAGHASMHEPVSDIGIGGATSASAQIDWPSGHVQDVPSLAVDGLTTIEEPPFVTFPVRFVSAGAGTPMPLTVRPVDAAGTPIVAQVDVASWSGLGLAWLAPLACDESGECKGSIATPKSEQTVYLKITIGGKVLRVAPKFTSTWE